MSSAVSDSAAIYRAIEADPFLIQPWRDLLARCQAQRDFISMQAVAVLVQGIEKINSLQPAPNLGSIHRSLFIRLSRACNSPNLLKEVGRLYLAELRLPDIAKAHLDLAVRLGGKNPQVEALIAQCNAAISHASENPANEDGTGIEQGKAQRPKVAALIRKTGKLSLGKVAGTDSTVSSAPPPLPQQPAISGPSLAELKTTGATGLLSQAQAWLKEGALDQARAAAEAAAELKPEEDIEKLWEIWTTLGGGYFERGQMDNAVAAYAAAHSLRPDLLPSCFNYGTALQRAGQFEESLKYYLAAERVHPGHPKVWCNLGTLYFQLDQFVHAESAFRRALQIEPEYARAWDNLGAALGAQNKLDVALDACRQAIKHKSDYREPWFKVGMIAYDLDDLDQAEEAFEKSADIVACGSYVHYFLGMIHARRGRLQEAAAACIRARDLEGYNAEVASLAWGEVGHAFLKMSEYASAVQAFQKASELMPESADAWKNLGFAHAERGHLPEALTAYERAAAIQPDITGVWLRIAQLASKINRFPVATAAWEKQVELFPEDSRSWYELGLSLEKEERFAECTRAFERATQLQEAGDVGDAKVTSALKMARDMK